MVIFLIIICSTFLLILMAISPFVIRRMKVEKRRKTIKRFKAQRKKPTTSADDSVLGIYLHDFTSDLDFLHTIHKALDNYTLLNRILNKGGFFIHPTDGVSVSEVFYRVGVSPEEDFYFDIAQKMKRLGIVKEKKDGYKIDEEMKSTLSEFMDYIVPKNTGELIVTALAAEDEDPSQAVTLYNQAMKKTKEFSLLIFLVCPTSLCLATILGIYIKPVLGLWSPILKGLILAYIGFGVPAMLRSLRDYHNGVISIYAPKKESAFYIVNALSAGPYFLFEQILITLAAIFPALLAVFPLIGFGLMCSKLIGIPLSLFIIASAVIGSATFCYALPAVLADMWYGDLWPPIIGLKVLWAGLRANIGGVFGYFSVCMVSYVFYWIEFGNPLLKEYFPVEELLINGLSGFFLALALSQGKLSNQMTAFIRLGLSRCHIRQHNWGLGRLPLRQIFTENTCEALEEDGCRALCNCLTNHLIALMFPILEGYRRRDLDEHIDRAEEIIEEGKVINKDIWRTNIKLNKLLSEDEGLRRVMDQAIERWGFQERVLRYPGYLLKLYVGVGVIFFFWLIYQAFR